MAKSATVHKMIAQTGSPAILCEGRITKHTRMTSELRDVTCKKCLKLIREGARKVETARAG